MLLYLNGSLKSVRGPIGWNLKRSTAQPSRAGALLSTTPSTWRQVWAYFEHQLEKVAALLMGSNVSRVVSVSKCSWLWSSRNISPAAGCLLQHQCLPGAFRAGLSWSHTGHETMWPLLLLAQVDRAVNCHQSSSFPAAGHDMFSSWHTGTTNWCGVPTEWTPRVTRPASSSQAVRMATSSCTTLQRSLLERVTSSSQRVTGTPGQWELSTSTPSRYMHCAWEGYDVCDCGHIRYVFPPLCCRRTWLHQVEMSQKSTSGTWITLTPRWLQDPKLRYIYTFLSMLYLKL